MNMYKWLKERDQIITREVEPERLDWYRQSDGTYFHPKTGKRWIPSPGRAVFIVPPWVDDKDLLELAETGGFP